MKFSVIVPAYNEEKRIGQTLRSIRDFARRQGLDCELIAVDDGSTDRTAEVIRQEFAEMQGLTAEDAPGKPGVSGAVPARRAGGGEAKRSSPLTCRLLLNGRNRGKGFSVRRGMLEACGDFVLFSDADLSTPIEELDKLKAAVDEGYDVAIGSRALAESRVEIHQNFMREMMGRIFNRIARLLTFRGIRDSQCGFKGFRRNAAYDLFGSSRIDGFSFDAEILFLAQKRGYKVKEIPVIWRNSPASKVAIFTDPVKMFWELFLIRMIHSGRYSGLARGIWSSTRL